MGYSIRIYSDMALYPGDFLARVTTLEACCVRVLDALCVQNQERAACPALLLAAGLANLIF